MKNRFYFLLILLGVLTYSCENAIEENGGLDADVARVLVTKTNPIDKVDINVVKQVAGMYGNMQGAKTRSGEEKAIEEVIPVKNEKGDVLMYVVNYAGNAGYVILSGKKECQPILAYSETGKFDVASSQESASSVWLQERSDAVETAETLPDSVQRQNMRAWNTFFDAQDNVDLVQEGTQTRSVDPDLEYQAGAFIEESLQKWSDEGYQIYPYGDGSILEELFGASNANYINGYLAVNAEDRFFDGFANTVYIRALSVNTDEKVQPLLKSTWSQTGGYGAHVPNGIVGCVAVAVGQIMRYHEYPLSYNWNAMAYSSSTDVTALFLSEVGGKVLMDYSNPNYSSSNEYRACTALKGYGYKNSQLIQHSTSYLVGQLKQKRPVFMKGVGNGEGHAWVCDGYNQKRTVTYYEVMALDKSYWDDTKQFSYRAMYSTNLNTVHAYYHMNWGWGGFDDGYFYEDAVNPGQYNFSTNRQDIIDIYPVK